MRSRVSVGFLIIAAIAAFTIHLQPVRGQQREHAAAAENEKAGATSDPAPPPPPMPPTRAIAAPVTTVEVNARAEMISAGLPVAQYASQEQILASAGTWGDFSRYLQVLPGVVWTSDYTNEIRVRGGDPNENLFVLDGIEVPNLNHLALEGTTGGFASMVDTTVVDDVEMNSGNYDLGLSRRLSSLVNIQTIDGINKPAMRQLDFGITGGGATFQFALAHNASLLASAHRSVLDLATSDIGLNGVPVYTNGIGELDWRIGNNDHVSFMNLSGADSIEMTPQPCDAGVTSQVNTTYGGSRSTSGFVWQHTSAARSSSTLTASYSSQNQDIDQVWIESPNAYLRISNCTVPDILVYLERTRDAVGTVNYKYVTEKRGWTYSSGAMARLLGLNYRVAQPFGAPSMFSSDPSWTDSTSFQRAPKTGQGAIFLEVNGNVSSRWMARGGVREETFALDGARFLNAQVDLAFRASEHQALHWSLERSGQLPPAINILSYPQNNRLGLIEAVQLAVGGELLRNDHADLSVEAYRKQYSNEPLSTEYPSLMSANMIDTLGQQFVWLPLRTGGTGVSKGLELTFRGSRGQRFRVLSDLTWAHTEFAAGDRIMRPGNFDVRITSNEMVTVALPWRFELSARNSFATARPYTPFNIPLSEEQHRGIYDLTRVNAARGPNYNRLDPDLIRSFRVGKGRADIHLGVENVLNRSNFLGFAWMDGCRPKPNQTKCNSNPLVIPGVPETMLSQMGRFPSAWVHYRF